MAEAPRERGAALGSVAPQVFLSHSSTDNEIVTRLAKNLSTCGVDVWFDVWELRGGVDLHRRISEAIEKSKYVAVVVSKLFDSSKWAEGEVHQALSREMGENRQIVVPLLIDDVQPPPVLRAKKHLDFTEKHYYLSLVRLVGMVKDLPTESIEDGIVTNMPNDVAGCLRALRFAGYHPFKVVDRSTLLDIEKAGGEREGERVHFDPRRILANPSISPSLRQLMETLTEEWDLENNDAESPRASY